MTRAEAINCESFRQIAEALERISLSLETLVLQQAVKRKQEEESSDDTIRG